MASAAGCTGDGSPEPPEPEPTQAGATARSQQTAAEAPAAEVEGSTQGGTITVRAATAPTTFDPTRVSSHQTEAILTNLVTRSLTQYQYDPATKQMVLVPDMATGLGRPNANFTRWTFTLRAGLKYETGAPVQATDVAYAIKRSFATDELPGGPTYNKRLYTGGEAYDGPYEDGPDLKGIEVDGRSITIKLRRPFADMPYLASSPQYTAIPAAADNPSEDYGNHPLATGPYKFAGYHPGSGLTLVRNPYWDPATDTTRHQYVDRWKFRWGAQAAATDKQLLTDDGAAQTSLSYDNVAPDLYDEAKQQAEDRLVTGTRPCTHMWYLDTRKIRSVKVRKAIGYAYPYRAAWRAAGEIAGVTRLPGTTILPPGTAGRVAYDPLGTKGVETDTARARTLLRKAGKTGYEVRFPFRSDTPSGVAAKNRIVGALESAGFKATPIATTEGQHRKQVAGRDSRQNVRAQT
ncbi:MAG: ABC transporter substrate-binding protein, partial [Nocardioidaceae bacterium]